MRQTYAVTWEEPGRGLRSGKLELRATGISLETSSNENGGSSFLLPYEDVQGVRMASLPERLTGRPTLVIERPSEGELRIASVAQSGIVTELADRLVAFRLGRAAANNRVAVVVPIRKRKQEKVRRLLDEGPPFDPEHAGLERHQVFVTDSEVVFVFEASSAISLKRLLGDAKVLATAASWRDCIAGPPRVARPFYSWATSFEPENVVFAAEPGPGDSDGGDIYSP